jgi:signal transduction histidine kinase
MGPVELMPHAVCWAAAPQLIWTMVITNAITFVSYFTICFTLLYLTRRTGRVIARDWRYFMIGFALFIVSCGSTHLLEVVTTWVPVFWIDAWANVITAVLSAGVCVVLIRRAGIIASGINAYADRLANVENEKLQMRESLVAAQKLEEWSRISASASHEIRGPLEIIQNLQYLIVNSKDVPAEIAELAQMSIDESHRVMTMSQSTLAFIRQSKTQEPIDISEALDSVRLVLEPLIRQKVINFHVDVKGDCVVEAYAGEIRQVLLNVVRNACEAVMNAGESVTVSLTGGSAGVEVMVSDEGPGIDAGIVPTLFEFGVSTKGEHGNGLGLWTVKHLLTKHGGEVELVEKSGPGACFRLWWPRSYVMEEAVV